MKYIMMLLGFSSFIVLTGCSPVLSRQDYGPVEEEWEQYIKTSYPAWKPAPSIPQAYPDQGNQQLPEPASLVIEEEKITIIEEPVIASEPKQEPVMVPATEAPKTAAPEATVVLDAEEPAPQPQLPVAIEGAKEGYETYTIQKGDTLSGIAYKFYNKGVLWSKIADYNNITNPNLIKAGQVIKIPVGKK